MKKEMQQESVEGLSLRLDCPSSSWGSAASSYFLSAKLVSTRDTHAFGQRAVVKLQNQEMLQFRPRGTRGEDQASPYMGFSAQGEAGPAAAERLPAQPKPRSARLASRAGQRL